MSGVFDVTIKDAVSPVLYELAKKSGKDFTPVMKRIEREIIDPLRRSAWNTSGLNSRSGALEAAVQAWHGKASAGVTLKAKGGRRDKGLVFAKAATHTRGAAKFSFKQGYRRTRLKGYDRRRGDDRHAKYLYRKLRRSPWGDIPARPFFVEEKDVANKKSAIINIILEHLQNAAAR